MGQVAHSSWVCYFPQGFGGVSNWSEGVPQGFGGVSQGFEGVLCSQLMVNESFVLP